MSTQIQKTTSNRLRQVVEAKDICPTLLDIDNLAQKTTNPETLPIPEDQHEEWIGRHLLTCENCQQTFLSLVALSKTSEQTVDKIAG